MLRTPPTNKQRLRRKRSSPLPIESKKSKLEQVCESDDFDTETEEANCVIENSTSSMNVNIDETMISGTPGMNNNKNGDKTAPTKQATNVKNKPTDTGPKKSKGRPSKESTASINFLESVVNDPESPLLKAFVNALIPPITTAIKSELHKHEKQMNELTIKINNLQTEVTQKNNHIMKLEKHIDDMEQYSRRNCLIISGLPESDNENCDNTVIKFARDNLKIDLKPQEIDRSHRLPGKQTQTNNPRPRNIIVKFTSYNSRRKVFENRKELKHCKDRIFINEQLTKTRNDLFYEARKLVKENKVKSAWTNDGNILIRDNAEKIRKIETINDIRGWTPV